MMAKEVRQCRGILAKLSAREMAKKQYQSTLTPLISFVLGGCKGPIGDGCGTVADSKGQVDK
jgi:hypothetical protein